LLLEGGGGDFIAAAAVIEMWQYILNNLFQTVYSKKTFLSKILPIPKKD